MKGVKVSSHISCLGRFSVDLPALMHVHTPQERLDSAWEHRLRIQDLIAVGQNGPILDPPRLYHCGVVCYNFDACLLVDQL